MVGSIVVLLVVVFVLWQIRSARRHKARRASLYQDSGGTWVWVDFDGSTRRSDLHPDKPGGDWHSSHSDHDGGGGGDDGGGDGGGD